MPRHSADSTASTSRCPKPPAIRRTRCGCWMKPAHRPRWAARGALLRVRHRRLAARRARRQLAGRRLGPERRLYSVRRPRRPGWKRWRWRWLVDLPGLPAGTGGGFVTGATMANFTASPPRATRCWPRRLGCRGAQGLFGAPPITVRGGRRSPRHRCSRRWACSDSAATASSGCRWTSRAACAPMPCPASRDRRSSACRRAMSTPAPSIPWREVCDRGARRRRVGACGRRVRAVGRGGPRRAGIWLRRRRPAELWATDAHKWLNVPYDSGLAFVRDPRRPARGHGFTAAYLPGSETTRSRRDYTPELSRRARGVEIWAALRSLGRQGVARADRPHAAATRARFADGLRGRRMRDSQSGRPQPGAGLVRDAGGHPRA